MRPFKEDPDAFPFKKMDLPRTKGPPEQDGGGQEEKEGGGQDSGCWGSGFGSVCHVILEEAK
jgi:hypothetical protein